jgi:hypothetical protein
MVAEFDFMTLPTTQERLIRWQIAYSTRYNREDIG